MKIKSKGVELQYSEENFDLINAYIDAFRVGTLSFNGSFDHDFNLKRQNVFYIRDQIAEKFEVNPDQVCRFAFSYHDETYLRMGILTSRSDDNLYFLTDGKTIKIGRTGNPKERLSTLQSSNPKKLKFIKIFSKRGSYEFKVHDLFKDIRLNGEWFKDDGQIRQFISLLSRNSEDLSNESLFHGED